MRRKIIAQPCPAGREDVLPRCSASLNLKRS